MAVSWNAVSLHSVRVLSTSTNCSFSTCLLTKQQNPLSLPLCVLTAIFQLGEPGFTGVYWSKGWWRWWWQLELYVIQSSSQIITTNKPNQYPVFLQAGCPSCRPTNSVKALNGKISHSMDLLTPSSPGGLPTLSLTANSSWLPWGGLPCLSSALWYQYP